jgi:hypothetical protein
MTFQSFFIVIQTHFGRLTAHHQCLLELFKPFHIGTLNTGLYWQFDHVKVFKVTFVFVMLVFGSFKDRIELGFLLF